MERHKRIYRFGIGPLRLSVERERIPWLIVGGAFPLWVIAWLVASFEPVPDRTPGEISDAMWRFVVAVERAVEAEIFLASDTADADAATREHLRRLMDAGKLNGVRDSCLLANHRIKGNDHGAAFLLKYDHRLVRADVVLREISRVVDLRGGPEALPWRLKSVQLSEDLPGSSWPDNMCDGAGEAAAGAS